MSSVPASTTASCRRTGLDLDADAVAVATENRHVRLAAEARAELILPAAGR